MAVKQSTAGHLAMAGTFAARSSTITCWFKVTSLAGAFMVFDLSDGSNHCSVFYTSGTLYVYGGGTSPSAPGCEIQANRWYYLSVTIASNGTATLWLGYNGATGFVRTDPTGFTCTIPSFTGTLWFADYSATGFQLPGSLQSVKVWAGSALSESEMVSEMGFTSPTITTNLHSYVTLATTSDYADSSGHSHGLTATGTWTDDTTPTLVATAKVIAATPKCIMQGDSRGTNSHSTYDSSHYLGLLMSGSTMQNLSHSGDDWSAQEALEVSTAMPNFETGTGKNVLIFLLGINDVGGLGKDEKWVHRWMIRCADNIANDPRAIMIVCVEIDVISTFANSTTMAAIRTMQRAVTGPWLLCDTPALQTTLADCTSVDFYTDEIHPVDAGCSHMADAYHTTIVANQASASFTADCAQVATGSAVQASAVTQTQTATCSQSATGSALQSSASTQTQSATCAQAATGSALQASEGSQTQTGTCAQSATGSAIQASAASWYDGFVATCSQVATGSVAEASGGTQAQESTCAQMATGTAAQGSVASQSQTATCGQVATGSALQSSAGTTFSGTYLADCVQVATGSASQVASGSQSQIATCAQIATGSAWEYSTNVLHRGGALFAMGLL